MKSRLPIRAEGCLSDLALDELLASGAAHPHLVECEACKARFASFERQRAAFVEAPQPIWLARKRRKGVWVASSGLVAAAAALAVFVGRRGPEDATRIKGTSSLGFYVKRGASVVRGANGDQVHPGDALRFTYSTSADPAYLAVLSLDGAHHASVYYSAGAKSARVPAAVDRALDTSTVLDASLGAEKIYGLFCTEAIEVEPLRSALEQSGTLSATRGCSADEIILHKVTR